MPGRHVEGSDRVDSDPKASRLNAVVLIRVVLALTVAAGIALAVFLPDSKNPPAPRRSTLPTQLSPTTGPGGVCLGEFLAVPSASTPRTASPKHHPITRVDFQLVNNGPKCHLVLPTKALLQDSSGSSRAIKLIPPSGAAIELAASAHTTLKLTTAPITSSCATRPSSVSSVSLEFGNQELQIALPAKYRLAAWNAACPPAQATTQVQLG